MLYGTVWASGIAAIGLMAISGSVNAGALAPVGASSAAVEPMVELARYNRHNRSQSHARPGGLRFGSHPHARPGGLRFGSVSPAQVCGPWKCTWRTSDGGCLTWERSCKKVRTIDPFN
jgi:hypothetical protein